MKHWIPAAEKAEGRMLLFDGYSLAGWKPTGNPATDSGRFAPYLVNPRGRPRMHAVWRDGDVRPESPVGGPRMRAELRGERQVRRDGGGYPRQ